MAWSIRNGVKTNGVKTNVFKTAAYSQPDPALQHQIQPCSSGLIYR